MAATVTKEIAIKLTEQLADGQWGAVEVRTSLTREYPESCTTEADRAQYDAKLARRVHKESLADIDAACEIDDFVKRVVHGARKKRVGGS